MSYILDDYFDWLVYNTNKGIRKSKRSFKGLLSFLHMTKFVHILENDENRVDDGKSLRWYYVCDGGDEAIMNWEADCTVLEMLIALSMKIESIMDNPDEEHIASQWFWKMLDNLNISHMSDKNFDVAYVRSKIEKFLSRKYDFDGHGNIFIIEDSDEDLRYVDIWTQTCWYLDNIIEERVQ